MLLNKKRVKDSLEIKKQRNLLLDKDLVRLNYGVFCIVVVWVCNVYIRIN